MRGLVRNNFLSSKNSSTLNTPNSRGDHSMSLADQRSTLSPSPRPTTTRLSPTAAYVAVVERLEETRRRVLRCTVAALLLSLAAMFLGLFALLVVFDWVAEL